MDTTVVTPQPGQTLIATEESDHHHRRYHRTDPWVLQGQANIRDDIGEAKYDLAESISDRAAELLRAQATREKMADYRLQDQAALIAELKMQAAVAKKP